MTDKDIAQFEVTRHYSLSQRGGFLIGQIHGGGKWLGEQIPTGDEPPMLTISGVEFLCHTKEGNFSQSLVFREQPAIEFLQRVFPAGTMIQLQQDEGQDHTSEDESQ